MMAKPWSEHRGTITRLYIQEGRTLEDVRTIMKKRYDFEASIRSYRQHFDLWSVGKYNCKKRQQRRQSLQKMPLLPSPPVSPPGTNMTPDSSNSSPDQKLLPLPSYLEIPVYGQPSPREEPKKYNPDYHMCHGHGIPQDIIPPHHAYHPLSPPANNYYYQPHLLHGYARDTPY